MLNKEKFAKEIIDIACDGAFAVVRGKPVGCYGTNCNDCLFCHKDSYFDTCNSLRRTWMNNEYDEPFVDWDKVPVDTPILVKDTEDGEWKKRYFAAYVDNRVCAWECGATSWSVSAESTEYMTDWEHAKLAETEE